MLPEYAKQGVCGLAGVNGNTVVSCAALQFRMFSGMEPRFWRNLQSGYDFRVMDRELRAKPSPKIGVFQPVAA